MSRFRRAAVWAVAMLFALWPGPAAAASGLATFVHEQLRFSIEYPNGWTPIIGSGVALAIVGPPVAGSESFRMNVVVTVEPVLTGVSEDALFEAEESQLRAILPAFQLAVREIVHVGGMRAALRHYTWERTGGLAIYQMQLSAVAHGRVYTVTGTTLAGSPHLVHEVRLLTSIILTFRLL